MISDQKRRFARLLAAGNHSFTAALEVLGEGETSEAVRVHEVWKNDPKVIAEVDRVKRELGEALLPSKEDIAAQILKEAEIAKDPKAKASLYTIYCDIRGFIGKNALVQVNSVTNKVMVVASSGSDNSWEQKIRKQQSNLIKNCAT